MGPKRKSKVTEDSQNGSSVVGGKSRIAADEVCSCERCGVYVSGMDSGDHERIDCASGNRALEHSHAVVDASGVGTIFGRLRERNAPEGFANCKQPLVFLNPRALRLCGFLVGKEAACWTGESASDSRVVVVLPDRSLPPFDLGATPSGMENLEASPGVKVRIRPVTRRIHPCDHVSFTATAAVGSPSGGDLSGSVVTATAATHDLTQFLRCDLSGVCLHRRSRFTVDFFGRKICLRTVRCSSCDAEPDVESDLVQDPNAEDNLVSGLRRLKLNVNGHDANSSSVDTSSFVTVDETGYGDHQDSSIMFVPGENPDFVTSTPFPKAKSAPRDRTLLENSFVETPSSSQKSKNGRVTGPTRVLPVFFRIGAGTRVEVVSSFGNPGDDEVDGAGEASRGRGVRLEDIGGLDHVLKPLLSNIETAHARRKVGPFPPPVGILLHGPGGTGKTLIGRFLREKYGDGFVSVRGPELFSKFLGETEAALKAKFDEAKARSPSIVFIDDVESLCGKKDSGSTSEQEGRLLAALVSSLDELAGPIPTGVIVVATTNKLSSVDASVRRAGRFDRELELGVPTSAERAAVLRALLARIRHEVDDAELDAVAGAAHGYVGADLALVCAEAASNAAKTRLPLSNGERDGEDDDDVATTGCAISGRDLRSALSVVKPSAMREILVDIPKTSWSDIGGMEELKLKLKQSVSWPLTHPEAFERMGVRPPRGLLMYGPPGCSKTLFAKALASESGLNFVAVKGPELFSKWVGESEGAVREVFRKARRCAPSIVFFDEIDAVAGTRSVSGGGGGGGANVQERVLAQLLTEMDGVVDLRDVMVVAATNRPDMVDPALLRPGRLDRIVYVPLPDLDTRSKIFEIHLRKTPVSDDVSIPKLAERTDGYSGAEIVAVCQEAAMQSLQESLDATSVGWRHFESALQIVRPRLRKEDLDLYESYSIRAPIVKS